MEGGDIFRVGRKIPLFQEREATSSEAVAPDMFASYKHTQLLLMKVPPLRLALLSRSPAVLYSAPSPGLADPGAYGIAVGF